MNKFIPLSVPNLSGNEKKYVSEIIDTEWVSTGGAKITAFENDIAKYVKSPYAVAVQSGTAGLHLAGITLGVSPNDEIIVPTLTFIAAVNPVKYCGAEPVFMDCDDSLCLDPVKLEKFFKEECLFIKGILINKKTKRTIKAIIAVHIFGNLCDMSKIMEIALSYNLSVIEDATEALGSYYTSGDLKGKHAGTIGHIGVFSFNGNKIITTGGGGMIVTNDEKIAKHCRYLSTQSKDDEFYFVHNEIGYNYRMTNLQAALGVAQLEQIEKFIETKKTNYESYKKMGLNLLPFRKDIRPNYWFYCYMSEKKEHMLKSLTGDSIQARPIWKLCHTQKPYQECQAYDIQVAQYYYDKVVNIPCSSNLKPEDVEIVGRRVLTYEKNS